MEKNMENEMETREYTGIIGNILKPPKPGDGSTNLSWAASPCPPRTEISPGCFSQKVL